MVSFGELWEIMSPLMNSGDDSRALKVIRSGKDMRDENESSFWDDFISLCSNVEGMSELFDVPPEKIRNWSSRIKEYVDELQKHDAESPNKQNDKELIPTGDTGAFITNADPNLGEI